MISRNELQALPPSQAAAHLTNPRSDRVDHPSDRVLGSQAPSKATQGMIQQKTVAAALSPDNASTA